MAQWGLSMENWLSPSTIAVVTVVHPSTMRFKKPSRVGLNDHNYQTWWCFSWFNPCLSWFNPKKCRGHHGQIGKSPWKFIPGIHWVHRSRESPHRLASIRGICERTIRGIQVLYLKNTSADQTWGKIDS